MIITTDNTTCPAKTALTGVPQKQTKLGVLYDVRDEVLAKTPTGKRYISLFYKHALEGVWLMARYPKLRLQTRTLLERFLPTLQELLTGQGATITQTDLADINALLKSFASKASPELRADLRTIQKELWQGAVLDEIGVRIRRLRRTP